MLISLSLLETFHPKILLASATFLKILAKETLKISDHFRSPEWFFLCFASDFACTDCFVCGGFVLVLPQMRAFQLPIGFRWQNCMRGFGMYSGLGASY